MSLWTCVACSARRAVGLESCPQCGAAAHEDGDTISGAEGGQGQRHIPPAAATSLQQAAYSPAQVVDAVAAPPPPADTPTDT